MTAPSLTSQNLDEKLGVAPRDPRILRSEKLGVAPRDPRILRSEEAYVAAHDHVDWCEMASHGFVVIDVDADRLRGEWWHVDTVLEHSHGVRLAAAYEVPSGEPQLRRATVAASSTAPPAPPSTIAVATT